MLCLFRLHCIDPQGQSTFIHDILTFPLLLIMIKVAFPWPPERKKYSPFENKMLSITACYICFSTSLIPLKADNKFCSDLNTLLYTTSPGLEDIYVPLLLKAMKH